MRSDFKIYQAPVKRKRQPELPKEEEKEETPLETAVPLRIKAFTQQDKENKPFYFDVANGRKKKGNR